MGGFGLDGFYGRVPCPYCGSTGCGIYGKARFFCGKTYKTVNEADLRKSAEKHKLTTYIYHHFFGWDLHEFTYVNSDFSNIYKVGEVELHNKYGYRGLCPNLKTAREFVSANRNNFRAYFRNSTEADE